jgi:glucose/mannose transport system permease protein
LLPLLPLVPMTTALNHPTQIASAKKRGSLLGRLRRISPAPFLLLPSFLIVSLFVYVFVGYTVGVSLAKNWRPGAPDFTMNNPPFKSYQRLVKVPRFQADIRNTVVFTVLFLLVAVSAGLVMALLVHGVLRARGFFRGLFLLPYALSFIVTGVVWRWLFNPVSGLNLLLRSSGVASAYRSVTGSELRPDWVSSPKVLGDISSILERIVPGGNIIQVKMGIPLALVAVVLAASWQLMGFAMAMFLAGLASIPEELREAAELDGASGIRYYRSIAIPLLKPMGVTAIVLLTHTAIKMFDLVYSMSGSGVGFATDMPGVFVYETMYKALRPDVGSAAAIVMFLLVCIVVVPYLIGRSKEYGHD